MNNFDGLVDLAKKLSIIRDSIFTDNNEFIECSSLILEKDNFFLFRYCKQYLFFMCRFYIH